MTDYEMAAHVIHALWEREQHQRRAAEAHAATLAEDNARLHAILLKHGINPLTGYKNVLREIGARPSHLSFRLSEAGEFGVGDEG